MAKKLKWFFKILLTFLTICICSFVIIVLILVKNYTKDLVKKGLLQSAKIEDDTLVFEVKEGYASGLIIRHDNNSIYNQHFTADEKISRLQIDDYSSIIDDKKIYHFMPYHYTLGGNQFSGFDFCIDGDQVYYGQALKDCSR